jgi:predicted RNA binding protein YcfA (HicA-like mRNA interferase family)
MRLSDLERELKGHGYMRARRQSSHRIYENCTGQLVVVALPSDRREVEKGHVREIRKQVKRHRVAQEQKGA